MSTDRDAGWSWIILLGAHLAFFLWEGLCKGLGVMVPTLTEQFDTETWKVGLAVGLMLAGRGLSGLMLGPLEHRWNHRQIAIASGLLAPLGVILASMTNNVVQFGLCLVLLTGTATGLVLNTALVLLGVYFDRLYAMANGIACAGTSVGILVSAPATQFILDVYGWRGCLLIVGGVVLHLVVVGALFRPGSSTGRPDLCQYTLVEPEECSTQNALTSGESEEIVESCTQQTGAGQLLSKIIRATDADLFFNFSFLVLVICVCNVCVVMVVWVVFTVPHLLVKGLTAYQASLVAGAGAIGILTGQLGHGLLVDKKIIGARPMVYVSHVLMAAGFMLDPLLYGLWPLIAGNFAFGVGFGIALPLSFTMLGVLVGPSRMSNAVGWAEAVGGIVRIAASFLTGWLYDTTGSYDTSFLVIGSLPVVVTAAFLIEDANIFFGRKRVDNKGPDRN